MPRLSPLSVTFLAKPLCLAQFEATVLNCRWSRRKEWKEKKRADRVNKRGKSEAAGQDSNLTAFCMPEQLAGAQQPCAEWRGEDNWPRDYSLAFMAQANLFLIIPTRMTAPRGQGLGQCLALTHAQLILAE